MISGTLTTLLTRTTQDARQGYLEGMRKNAQARDLAEQRLKAKRDVYIEKIVCRVKENLTETVNNGVSQRVRQGYRLGFEIPILDIPVFMIAQELASKRQTSLGTYKKKSSADDPTLFDDQVLQGLVDFIRSKTGLERDVNNSQKATFQ